MNSTDLNTYGLSTKEVQEILNAFASEIMSGMLRQAYKAPSSIGAVCNATDEEYEDFSPYYLWELSCRVINYKQAAFE